MYNVLAYFYADYFDAGTPVEKVRRLLNSLHKRSPEAFEHFQSALRENGCGDLTAKDDDVRTLEAELDTLPTFQRLSLN